MKNLFIITSALILSLSAFAKDSSGVLSCEVRNAKGAEAIISKNIEISRITGSNSEKIEIGFIDDTTVNISLAGYYAGEAIIELEVSSKDGSLSTASGKAGGILRYKSIQEGKFIDVLCRELTLE